MTSRRSFLQQSFALGAGALLPFSRLARAATSSSKPPYLVVVVVAGGWDTTYCLDPKFSGTYVHGPDSDTGGNGEAIETFGQDMRIMVNDAKRPSVSSFFQSYADVSTIVSGIAVGSVTHRACMDRMLTGTQSTSRPDFAAIVGSTYGSDRPLACLDTCGQSRAGNLAASIGRLGARSQIVTLLDREETFDAPADMGIAYPQIVPAAADQGALDAYRTARIAALEAKRASGGRNATHIANYRESLERQTALRAKSEVILDAIRLGHNPANLDLSLLVADLFTGGVCQTVLVDSNQDWDTHAANDNQHDSYEGLFALLNDMMGTFETAGILEETVVAVVSEMSRTPMLNDDRGKDHWPVTSTLLVGPRVGTGRTLGGTTDEVSALPVDLASGEVYESGTTLTYDSFTAGLLEALDVDPEEWLPGTTPLRIV
jgi:hypothetical protein